MARNAIITAYDWAQDPNVTISGGSWEVQLPATNMLTLQAQVVAQVVGTGVSFTIDLGASRTIGLIHLQRFITDSTGVIQVTAGSYDSGVVNSWATDNVGTYPPLLYAGLGRPRVFIPPTPVVASSVSFTINGIAAPLQIGYVGICEVLEIPGNMLVGNIRGIIDESSIDQTPFGSTYVTLRAKRRRLDFGVGGLGEDNGDFVAMSDLSIVNGRSFPVVVSKFPDDTNNLERNTIWGLMTNDQPFTNSFYGHCDATFQITQMV
jgi:hypothetical protein